jgi:cation diffusion facilitator CzcD-associated flavoprotein CzcO
LGHFETIILGAGMSGLCVAARLKSAGMTNFVILEKAHGVGGTWRDNTYPGVACDVPSHLYSFSFSPNPDWRSAYASGPEILAYCEQVARRCGLIDHLRPDCLVRSARYLEDCADSQDSADGPSWEVELDGGRTLTGNNLVVALGGLHVPAWPEIEGIGTFGGDYFHSARWNHSVDVEGKRVALIGTGASSVQITPAIAPTASHLTVYQRTPAWVLPRGDYRFTDGQRRRFRDMPLWHRLYRLLIYARMEALGVQYIRKHSYAQQLVRRLAESTIARVVTSPSLRRCLTPDYAVGCKRACLSDDYLPAFNRPDVTLVTDEIARITAAGIEDREGNHHDHDVIVFATGFKPFNVSGQVDIRGRNNLSLAQAWDRGARAHRTMMIPDFPNLFVMLGPNSGLGHTSVILMIEAQARYLMGCLSLKRRRGVRELAPKAGALQRYDSRLQQALGKTVFGSGCGAWYTDEADRNFTLWPYSTIRYFLEMWGPRSAEFEMQYAARGSGNPRPGHRES